MASSRPVHLPCSLLAALLLTLAGCGSLADLEPLPSCVGDEDCLPDEVCGAEGYCVLRQDPSQPCGGACGPDEQCDPASDRCICPSAGRACTSGEACCEAGCIDLGQDAANCGACGAACGAGEQCLDGICTCGGQRAAVGQLTVCDAPAVCCDGRCADPRFDTHCCGTLEDHVDCGSAFCANGLCACPAGAATCNDAQQCATNILSDAEHCGGCGFVCAEGASCLGGTCSCGGQRCGPTESCCDNGCADLLTDRLQCGSCGMRCASGERCVDGACGCGTGPACGPGTSCCGGQCVLPDDPACICGGGVCTDEAPDCCGDTCVDLVSDAMNCGECGAVCGANQTCSGGRCVCDDETQTLCGDTCVDVLSSTQHCGTCGNACGAGQTCCSGQCKNLSSDLQNCGACGSFCGGDSCTGGQCSCGGTPVDLSSDLQNCGTCSTSCERLHVTGESCIGGTCSFAGATCEPGFADCNNNLALDGCEADLDTSDKHCGACGQACTPPTRCIDGQCSARDDVVQVATGDEHTCARQQSGRVVCWGRNNDGQLGTGNTQSSLVPVPLGGNLKATHLAVGWTHGCIVTDDGRVFCWGRDDDGEIGGASGVVSTPREISLPSGALATRVGLGSDHSCAIVDRTAAGGAVGEVWCWGSQANGRLGNGTSVSGRVTKPVRAIDLTGATDIDGGARHTCALRNDGTIWCWGTNLDGEASAGGVNVVTRPTQIQLDGQAGGPFVDVDAGRQSGFAVNGGTGYLWRWGRSTQGSAVMLDSIIPKSRARDYTKVGNFARVAVGDGTACGLSTNGAALCWGDNQSGELGDGRPPNDRSAPTAVVGLDAHVIDIDITEDHACAVLSPSAPQNPGGVMCWGNNSGGRLGDGTTSNRSTPVNVLNLP